MRGKGRKLGFSEKDIKIICKYLVKEIVNKENKWDHMTEANMVKDSKESIEKVAWEEMLKAMKLGKAAGRSEV